MWRPFQLSVGRCGLRLRRFQAVPQLTNRVFKRLNITPLPKHDIAQFAHGMLQIGNFGLQFLDRPIKRPRHHRGPT